MSGFAPPEGLIHIVTWSKFPLGSLASLTLWRRKVVRPFLTSRRTWVRLPRVFPAVATRIRPGRRFPPAFTKDCGEHTRTLVGSIVRMIVAPEAHVHDAG